MATNQNRLNESLLHVVPSEPIAKVMPPNMSIVTCSPYDQLTEFEKHVPTLDDVKSWTAERVHQELGTTLFKTTVNYLTAKNLVADIKRRLQAGETVGGCTKWNGVGGYVDRHIKKADETLPVVIRRLYRQLDGEAVNPKHNGTVNRKPKKLLPKKPNRVDVEEGIARHEYARGPADGKRIATTPTDAETVTETFYILRREKGRAISRHDAKTEEDIRKFIGTKNRVFKVEATYVLTAVSQ